MQTLLYVRSQTLSTSVKPAPAPTAARVEFKRWSRNAGAGILVMLSSSLLWAGQQRQAPATPTGLADAQHYEIEVELQPETHHLKGNVRIDFVAVEAVQEIVVDLNRNCSVTQVFDKEDHEVEHTQDDYETYTVRVKLRDPVSPGDKFSLRFVYEGSFDRGSRRTKGAVSEVEAVVADEGIYLPYASKWFPIYRFLVDRATTKMIVSVPLGFTAIGPGQQLPSQVKGIAEVFTSVCEKPILPGSLVADQLFPKSVDQDGLKAEFAVEESELPACERIHAALLPYARYFRDKLGPLPWGETLTIVEVANASDYFPGAPGVLYVPKSMFELPKPNASLLARRLAYQWWGHALSVPTPEDAWLLDGSSFYAPIAYVEAEKGPDVLRDELGELEVIALQGEGKSALQNAYHLGFMGEDYLSLAGGKGAWVLHMLRSLLGDDKFERMMSQWRASAAEAGPAGPDFRTLVGQAAGEDLKWFFMQWVESIGVPQFEIEYITLKTRTGFKVSGTIKQDRDLFRMPVEVAVEGKGKTERSVVTVEGKRSDFRVNVDTQPTHVIIDPNSRVLRDSPELKVAVLISRGRRLYDREQFVESIQEYDEALRLNSRRSLASFYLGETFYAQWNLQSAANAFRDALNGDQDPKWIEVWSYIYLGKVFDILGQRDRAIAEYQKAVNTKNDYNGAQAEVQKWIKQPFTRERTVLKK